MKEETETEETTVTAPDVKAPEPIKTTAEPKKKPTRSRKRTSNAKKPAGTKEEFATPSRPLKPLRK